MSPSTAPGLSSRRPFSSPRSPSTSPEASPRTSPRKRPRRIRQEGNDYKSPYRLIWTAIATWVCLVALLRWKCFTPLYMESSESNTLRLLRKADEWKNQNHFRNYTHDYIPTTDGIPLFESNCIPMIDWQLAYHPTCNSFHELDYSNMRILGEGGARIAWKPQDQDAALKMTKYKYVVPTRRLYETWRVDVMISERLTASKHVLDVYGHCGISSLNQIATTDPHWYKHHDQTSAEKFALGLQLAHAVADLHSIDGDGNATAVWRNGKPENILFINGTLKITDFDESVLQRWDAKKQEPCKFRLPTLTDPAAKRFQAAELSIDGGPLDEKIDIYALGGIFYSLLASTRPYRNDTDHLIHKKAGILPTYPANVKNETMTLALRNAAERCMAHDPRLRPTARQVVNELEQANRQRLLSARLGA